MCRSSIDDSRRSMTATVALLVAMTASDAGPASAGGAWAPIQPCGRPLREVRALWKAAEDDRDPKACRTKETLWLELRRCYAGFGEWLPDIRTIGDCHVAAQDAKAASAFYRRVMVSFRELPCTTDGWTCGRAAAVELRLLDCGFGWLASDPETAWRDFVTAVRNPASATPTAFHVLPRVNEDDLEGTPDVTCGALLSVDKAFRGGIDVGIPSAILRNGQQIAETVARSAVAASHRAVSVELNAGERRWALTNRNAAMRFLRMQVCPFQRPHIGPRRTMYFVELNLSTIDDRERAVCQSPWSWIGRRVP